MRLLQGAALLLSSIFLADAASSWTFSDATVTTQGKGAGVGGGVKESISPNSVPANAVTLSPGDTLKVVLTTLDGKSGKRPHQAFLTLEDLATGLQDSFPFNVKDSGKAKVELTSKDLPDQLIGSAKPLKASIVLGSFGSSIPYNSHAFDLAVAADSQSPAAASSAPERYTTKPEIHHVFRDDPRSPPRVISLFFTLAVLVTVPALLGTWLFLGGNIAHFGKAFSNSPLSHALFLGSIVAMEGVFFLYYTSWNLFQTLPAMAIVGAVAYLSGSKALTEVQERRLSGER